MTAPGGRIGGLRTIRIAVVLIGVGTIANSAASVVSFRANSARVQQINDERAANVQRSCEDVNKRHDDTLRALDRLLAQAQQRASREQIKRSRASTTLLIDSLAPERDCAALAREQVATN